MWWCVRVIGVAVAVAVSVSSAHRCHPVPTETCGGLYNATRLPNSFGHASVAAAESALRRTAAVAAGCSGGLTSLLCLAYLPPCGPVPALPCRRACQTVLDDCAPLLDRRGFRWPSELDCDRLPRDENTCLQLSGQAASSRPEAESAPPLQPEVTVLDGMLVAFLDQSQQLHRLQEASLQLQQQKLRLEDRNLRLEDQNLRLEEQKLRLEIKLLRRKLAETEEPAV